MRQIQLVLCLAAVLVLAFPGCGPKSPEEQVAATRAQYTVKLESFTKCTRLPTSRKFLFGFRRLSNAHWESNSIRSGKIPNIDRVSAAVAVAMPLDGVQLYWL